MEKELAEILKVVNSLYLKYGIKRVTMHDIAIELGMSKKTLYQYFENKEALVYKVLFNEMKSIFDSIGELKNQNLNVIDEAFERNKIISNAIRKSSPALNYDLKRYFPKIYKKLSEYKTEKTYSSIVANINKGVEQGLFRDDLNVDIIAKIHICRIENLADNDSVDFSEYSPNQVFNEVFIYHNRGICSGKGLKLLEKKLQEIKKEQKND
ncbi:MAG: TetR/AcrR family transcriptional regulator [Bacteroidetes bacterium]|nr:TetR/AcrR family transcriptional regulator [Bacteroidota bacterium]